MELSTHWESITAENSDDNAQLKRDMRNHPRTTGRSLRELARICATAGSFVCQKQLDAAFDWLTDHRSELPREIEDDNGNRGSDQRLETTKLRLASSAVRSASTCTTPNCVHIAGIPAATTSCVTSGSDAASRKISATSTLVERSAREAYTVCPSRVRPAKPGLMGKTS